MEKIKFDLTNQQGLISALAKLKILNTHGLKQQTYMQTRGAKITFEIDIEKMFEDLTNMISTLIETLFDLFDDTKKLEKQMELATKTIEISRAAGAKSIDITVNSKNEDKLKLFIEEIDATIGGKLKKDNTITYSIKF